MMIIKSHLKQGLDSLKRQRIFTQIQESQKNILKFIFAFNHITLSMILQFQLMKCSLSTFYLLITKKLSIFSIKYHKLLHIQLIKAISTKSPKLYTQHSRPTLSNKNFSFLIFAWLLKNLILQMYLNLSLTCSFKNLLLLLKNFQFT